MRLRAEVAPLLHHPHHHLPIAPLATNEKPLWVWRDLRYQLPDKCARHTHEVTLSHEHIYHQRNNYDASPRLQCNGVQVFRDSQDRLKTKSKTLLHRGL